jgi:Skp family chaperone for outer membrane proteins
MQTRITCSIVLVLCVAISSASIQTAAHGGVIGTQQYLSAVDREAAIARIDAVLAREEVRNRLEHYGVDPADAQARVAALTDEELETLANDLDNLPAGGDLLAVVGIVFLVLLILELVGVIDIFKKI